MMMELMLIVAAVIAGLVLLLTMFASAKTAYPYTKGGPLLSAAEAHFLRALSDAVSHRYNVATKVRVADVIKVRKGLNQRNAIIALNKIAAKHVDFVLTDPATHQCIAAVELDDASHARADRRKRDLFLDGAFKAAGLPLVRIKAGRGYDRAQLAAAVDEAINPPTPQQNAKRAPSTSTAPLAGNHAA